MQIVINRGPGELELSARAYERLIELGVPCYPPADFAEHYPEDVCIYDMSLQDGMVITDNPDDAEGATAWLHSDYRYSAFWLSFVEHRSHPLLLQVVNELGDAAGAPGCVPVVWEIPDGKPLTLTRDAHGWEIVAWPNEG